MIARMIMNRKLMKSMTARPTVTSAGTINSTKCQSILCPKSAAKSKHRITHNWFTLGTAKTMKLNSRIGKAWQLQIIRNCSNSNKWRVPSNSNHRRLEVTWSDPFQLLTLCLRLTSIIIECKKGKRPTNLRDDHLNLIKRSCILSFFPLSI